MAGSFQDYVNKNADRIDTVLIGAFIPGAVQENVFTEADESQNLKNPSNQIVSKTPILMDEKDAEFVSLYLPPRFARRMLQYRYKDLVFTTKKHGDRASKINRKINLTTERSKVTAIVNSDGPELLKKLETPINYEEFRNMSPEDRDKYTGGLYGYDLSNMFRNPETGELMGAAYIGMESGTASRVIKDWRRGAAIGWLNRQGPMKQINLGTGRKKHHHEYFVDADGNVFKEEPGKIWTPVYTGEELARLDQSANAVTNDGKYIWRYAENGKYKEHIDYVPKLPTGRLVNSSSVRAYNMYLTEFNQTLLSGNKKAADQLIAEMQHHIHNSNKFTAFDYNVHEWNTEITPDGRRKYPTIATSNSKGFANFNPNKNQKGQQPGSTEDQETAAKYFIGEKNNGDLANPRWLVQSMDGNWITSATQQGVVKFLRSISGSIEYYTMNAMFGDIVAEAMTNALANSGNPRWTEVLAALRGDESPIKNTKELEQKYKLIFQAVQRKGFDFAQEVGQLDMGRGSRRNRQSGQGSTIQGSTAIGAGGDEISYDQLGGQKVTGAMAEIQNSMINFAIRKRRRGERRDTRRPGEPKEIFWAHDINQIKSRIEELSGNLSTIQVSKPDQEDIEAANKMKQQIDIRTRLFESFITFYGKEQMKNGNNDWSMEDAITYANAHLRTILKQKGIEVSEGIGEAEPTPKSQKELDFLKSQINSAAKTITDDNEDMVFSQKEIADFLTYPEKIKEAIGIANNFSGETRTDILDALQHIQKYADQLHGRAAPTIELGMPPKVEKWIQSGNSAVAYQNHLLETDPDVSDKMIQYLMKRPKHVERLRASAEKSGHPMPLLQRFDAHMAKINQSTPAVPAVPIKKVGNV